MNASPLRYIMYVRKSSEAEDRQVASIQSQIDELNKIAQELKLNVIEILTEEKSAKKPGRLVFSEMIQKITDGKADAILCWKLDRLARNPIDGGSIVWMLQQRTIHHIQTFGRSYYPNDNVLMIQVEFGMANQFILDLSVNTKRGQRAKLKDGWLPHKPPLGYLNNIHNLPDKPPIFKDPERFPLMQNLWKILLKERCTLEELYAKAQRMGLKPYKAQKLVRSNFYFLFHNPFFYGANMWNGEITPGKHEPMITKQDFELAQKIINGKSYPRKKINTFAFRGLIRCGECGAMITAELKIKHLKNGEKHHHIYYRCTKRIKPCSQKPSREDDLEKQIIELLKQIEIPPSFHSWAIKKLKEEQNKEITDRGSILETYQKKLRECDQQLNKLLQMRMNEEITAEELANMKTQVLKEKNHFEGLLADSNQRVETWLDRAEKLFDFAKTAKLRFETGDFQDKREILAGLGLNILLLDKKLEIPVDSDIISFKKHAPEVQELHNRLEPTYPVENIGVWEEQYTQNIKWGG